MADSVEASKSKEISGEFNASTNAEDLLAQLPQPDVTAVVEAVATDPWANSPWTAGVDTANLERPARIMTDAEIEAAKAKPEWVVKAERKEAITEASLSITIDKAALATILDGRPDLISHGNAADSLDRAREIEAQIERRADLQRTIDAIAALPEHLNFQPGITLVLGENGVGKSTLAKALQLAAEVAEWVDQFGGTFEEAKKMVLQGSDSARSTSSVRVQMSGLAPDIARAITVDEMQNYGYLRYYDAAELMGSKVEKQLSSAMDYRLNSQIDGSRNRSHRQTIDADLFEYVKANTERELAIRRARAENHPHPLEEDGAPNYHANRSSEGPQIYFFDEPEVGMSPRRQRALEAQLKAITMPGSVLIIPTNSTVLYDTDLPRIDLEFPERGIFGPSEYPED
ncbi:AAA family ATPase [Candidatus Saccharibacteria bacterium]|nr:AAA family ATPase [Candidatus Saccharibacteria bacterium]